MTGCFAFRFFERIFRMLNCIHYSCTS
uniref:Uncharacterized protein n=1 Tax=Anguilla anguilla TaxID=7936 RepID=A0A0E9W9K6_ANGAN